MARVANALSLHRMNLRRSRFVRLDDIHRLTVRRTFRLQCWHAPDHHVHRLAAATDTAADADAAPRRSRWHRRGRHGPHVQHLQQPNGTRAVVMLEAEVARPAQTRGQHLLQHQPQEVGAGKCALRHLVGLGVAVLEGHVATLVAAQDVAFPDRAAIQDAAPNRRARASSLVDSISELTDRRDPNQKISLKNGQVWQVIDGSTGTVIGKSKTVTIRRAVLGSYWMEFEGLSKAPKVQRLK